MLFQVLLSPRSYSISSQFFLDIFVYEIRRDVTLVTDRHH